MVLEAANADEALATLRERSLRVRVLFSDVRMAGSMDGLGLAREVRSLYPEIKIVSTSGHPAMADYVEHDGFFSKPYDPAAIVRHVEALLA